MRAVVFFIGVIFLISLCLNDLEYGYSFGEFAYGEVLDVWTC